MHTRSPLVHVVILPAEQTHGQNTHLYTEDLSAKKMILLADPRTSLQGTDGFLSPVIPSASFSLCQDANTNLLLKLCSQLPGLLFKLSLQITS